MCDTPKQTCNPILSERDAQHAMSVIWRVCEDDPAGTRILYKAIQARHLILSGNVDNDTRNAESYLRNYQPFSQNGE